MKRLVKLLLSDFKLIVRDRTLSVLLALPFILVIFFRLLIPWITEQYPIIEEYHPMIIMFGSIQTAISFGFLSSFMILEEKDENVLQAIRVLPISSSYFIFYRIAFASFFSAFGALLMFWFTEVVYLGLLNSLLIALLYGLSTPVIVLIIVSFAKNKIEGLAYFKTLDLLLLLPIASFFLTGITKYIFGILPTYWTFHAFNQGVQNQSIVLFLGVAISFHIALIFILYFQFKKRVFDR